jgi:hypothetical protein
MATTTLMGPDPYRAPLGRLFVALTALGVLTAPGASAQGVRTLDPFYQGESARRDFYGGLAVSGEVAYRTADLLRPGSGPAAPNDLALSVQLDYALLPQVDVAAVIDLSGGIGRGPTGLSWVVVKPYWFNEDTDYAVRLAVDPASEGGLGFRQTDVAFLSSTTYGPALTSDFVIGLRRVRTGYTLDPEAGLGGELGAPLDGPVGPGPEGPGGVAAALAAEDGVRVIGREIHATWGYNVLFDPAGSHVAVALLAEAGDYRLIPTGAAAAAGEGEERVRSGIGWLRAGLEFSRPAYQISPFLAVPLVTWADVSGEPVRHGPRPDRTRFGVRLMLR